MKFHNRVHTTARVLGEELTNSATVRHEELLLSVFSPSALYIIAYGGLSQKARDSESF